MKSSYILIIGSRPGLEMPIETPLAVFCANSALSRAQGFLGRCNVTSVISNYLLLMDNCGSIAARNAIKGCSANDLLVFSLNDDHAWREAAEKLIAFQNARFLHNANLLKAKASPFAAGDILKLCMVSLLRYRLRSLFSQARKAKPKVLHLSTGVLSLALAMRAYPNVKNFYLAGIGLSSGGHFYDNSVLYPNSHNDSDKLFLRAVVRNMPHINLRTDDPGLTSYLDSVVEQSRD